MINQIYFERINKLKNLIKSKDEAILLTNELNIEYFCGFRHSEGSMLITVDETYLFVDFRYIEAAQSYAKNCKVICFKKFISDLSEKLLSNAVKYLYFETENISVAKYFNIKKELQKINVDCVDDSKVDEKISEVRIIKSEFELDKIQKAQQIAESAYNEILNYIKSGVSERKIAVEFEYLMKKNGAEDISFDLITITGKKTSLPHGVPSNDVIQNGDFFTMDFGAVYDGYHSDTTRTVAVGYADDEMQKVYDIVLKAQLSALNIVKDGVLCSEVDRSARSVIEENGYGKYFGHATGHGVGLEIHEAPTVSPKSNTILKSGMVITDEPGIYLPKKFGVRIEDMIYVTENGYVNFVTLPKELVIL